MTKDRAIQLLLTKVGDMTEEHVSEIIENRPFINEVKKSKEYFSALTESLNKQRRTAGATYTPHLDAHITHASGRLKTVCVSAALAFFNISPDRYHYCGSEEQDNAILRRHGWSVRSRKSKLLTKRGNTTLGMVRKSLAMGKGEKGHYMAAISTSEGYHCIVLDSQGQVVVDTAPEATNNGCRVRSIYLVKWGSK